MLFAALVAAALSGCPHQGCQHCQRQYVVAPGVVTPKPPGLPRLNGFYKRGHRYPSFAEEQYSQNFNYRVIFDYPWDQKSDLVRQYPVGYIEEVPAMPAGVPGMPPVPVEDRRIRTIYGPQH